MKPAGVPTTIDWSGLGDAELMRLRFRELGLDLESSSLRSLVDQVRGELRDRGLELDPRIYFGDEWFSPEGEVAVAVPFYLAHPRLVSLERAQLLEAEGESPEMFLKLLRHELGHCFDHAFRVSRRPRWKKIFGPPDLEYEPENYRPRPYSHSYVRHLPNWYAQAHPDEDFAETFAVWLDPSSRWAETYRRWPVALAKLRYVDELAREFRAKPAPAASARLPYDVSRMSSTLDSHYRKRRRENAQDRPDFFDPDLRRVFHGTASKRSPRSAARFLRSRRDEIVDSVHEWTKERKFVVAQLLRRVEKRCEELGLGLADDDDETLAGLRVSAFVSATVLNFLFTGRFKRSY